MYYVLCASVTIVSVLVRVQCYRIVHSLRSYIPPPNMAWCSPQDNYADIMAIGDPLSDLVVVYRYALIYEDLVVGAVLASEDLVMMVVELGGLGCHLDIVLFLLDGMEYLAVGYFYQMCTVRLVYDVIKIFYYIPGLVHSESSLSI